MEYEAFVSNYMKELKEGFGEDVELVRRDFPKINGPKDGISVVYSNSPISPTIYLKDKFEDYERGFSIREISESTILDINRHKAELRDDIKMNEVLNKDNIYCSLVNEEMNKDLLQDVPHRKIEDLAIISRCRVGSEGSFIVTNEMCSQLKMTPDEIIDQAKSNTLNEVFECRSMTEVMRSIMESDGMPEEIIDEIVMHEDQCPMYILSNKSGMDGAVAMLSTDTLESARDKIGEDFYILPSSRHEIILVPESKIDDEKYLKDMVSQVNSTSVPKEDILSDSVYKYEGLKKAFSTVKEISMVTDRVTSKLEENMNLMTSTKTR